MDNWRSVWNKWFVFTWLLSLYNLFFVSCLRIQNIKNLIFFSTSIENRTPWILTSLSYIMKIEYNNYITIKSPIFFYLFINFHPFKGEMEISWNQRMRLGIRVWISSTESPRSDDRTTIKITWCIDNLLYAWKMQNTIALLPTHCIKLYSRLKKQK